MILQEISIIIPVFNEQDSITETIGQMEELIKRDDFDFNVVIVNDCSTDSCYEILDSVTNPSIKIINHTTNRGYGAALKTGIAATSAPYICITDADGTYPNHEITTLGNHLKENYSMIVGARTGEVVKIPKLRRFPKWVLNKLANYLTNTKIPDINSGFRIMKRTDVERFIRILPDGFSFTTTITLAMLTNDLPVHFVPINYYHRKGKSKIRPIYDTINFIQLIIRTVMYFNPLKIFIPLSGILVACAVLVLLLSWIMLGQAMDVTFGVIIMAAVIVLAIGMLADLIDKRLA
jgi:glycosyltransferase involved in cell wall biosynthesis